MQIYVYGYELWHGYSTGGISFIGATQYGSPTIYPLCTTTSYTSATGPGWRTPSSRNVTFTDTDEICKIVISHINYVVLNANYGGNYRTEAPAEKYEYVESNSDGDVSRVTWFFSYWTRMDVTITYSVSNGIKFSATTTPSQLFSKGSWLAVYCNNLRIIKNETALSPVVYSNYNDSVFTNILDKYK